MELREYRTLGSTEHLRMKIYLAILLLGTCYLGFIPRAGAQTTQQKAREIKKEKKAPKLFEFDSTYLASVQAERNEFLRQKIVIDCLDISNKKREKLLRDLYKHKRSKRLNKILLATIIFEEDTSVDRDPEKDK